MSWLTGKEIERQYREEKIHIAPFSPLQLNPNSYDYRLDGTLKRLLPNAVVDGVACIDPRKIMSYEEVVIPREGFLLQPGRAYLGATVERFGSAHYASLVTGKSSVGRLFIGNHYCAGLVDQGFFNHLTLEITAQLPTLVFSGMRFGQIFWFESVGECALYQGKYKEGDNRATPSRVMLDLET